LLKKKAEEGVKIYVLIWNETKIAVDLNSQYSASVLEKLHPTNVKVIRHPLISPVKWSHHQKTVIVDEDIAVSLHLPPPLSYLSTLTIIGQFVGGLDLAFGRYDGTSLLPPPQQII